MKPTLAALLFALATGGVQADADAARATLTCGTVVTLATHAASQTRTSWVTGAAQTGTDPTLAVVLLVGGGGTLAIDDAGCPHRLKGNVLIRSLPLLQAAGVSTVLVDAPSDWSGDEGLAGFRLHPDHAQDLGRLIADVRVRTGASAVWVMGHSRGTLSAANAASRLSGAQAPDGVVLASAMLSGEGARRKAWAAQTVQETRLKDYRGALLLVGHAADNCQRSLPELMDAVVQGASASRLQVVQMAGGPGSPGRAPSLATCEVGEPHDFAAQEARFAAGVLRFMRGGLF